MDLDPGSWGGLELGLKIGPVKTSTAQYPPPALPHPYPPQPVCTTAAAAARSVAARRLGSLLRKFDALST